MTTHRLLTLLTLLILLTLAAVTPAAAAAPSRDANFAEKLASLAPLAGPCAPGAAYDPACDVDHDGDVDVMDVQLAAGHWNQSGVWTGGDFWSLTGNAGTNPTGHFLGTSDDQPFIAKVNGQQALRLEPAYDSYWGFSPNVIAGNVSNSVGTGWVGATIAGGGSGRTDCGLLANVPCANRTTARFATVGGGLANTASGSRSSVSGGSSNTASEDYATVGGGYSNTASQDYATVGGGYSNTASKVSATVSGGYSNIASEYHATVGGGWNNEASGTVATVPGGIDNTAGGQYSFAAGRRAKANHDGAFVWADSIDADYASTAANTFNVRAANGVIVDANTNGNGLQVINSGADGVGIYAQNTGSGKDDATLRANNTETSGGIAAYLTNDSNYSTMHAYNGSSGEVLYLQNGGDSAGGGGGDFIKAVNEAQSDTQFRVTTTGEARSDIGFTTPAADFAEMLPAVPGLEPGDVLAVGPDGRLIRTTAAYQSTVMGVYSTRPGFVGGMPMEGEALGKVPLAVVGIVPVKASGEGGAIQPGDLLTASATPGHAMKAKPDAPQGTVIGKALEPLNDGAGMILMLVILQ